MKWLGAILMIASALTGLIAWFVFDGNKPVSISASVFFLVGLIIFLAAGERRDKEVIKTVDKKE